MTQPPLFVRIGLNQHANARRRHHGLILILREDIQSALNEGWSRRAIWKTLFSERRVTVRYHAFLRYLRAADILGPQPRQGTVSARPPEPRAQDGFQFNRRPDEKDLA